MSSGSYDPNAEKRAVRNSLLTGAALVGAVTGGVGFVMAYWRNRPGVNVPAIALKTGLAGAACTALYGGFYAALANRDFPPRHAHPIAPDEPSLLGSRPSSADARSAWDTTVAFADETLRTLQRPRGTLARLAGEGRDRPRER